jgi:PAS domain S-box-containing protein
VWLDASWGRALEAIVQPEGRYEALLEAAPDAMLVLRFDGRLVLVNQQVEKLFGYGRAELIGQPIEMLLPERLREKHVGYRTKYFADPITRPMGVGVDLCGLRKNGTEFPAEVSLAPLHSPDGLFVTAAIRDISDRKRAEQLFRDLLEAAPDAMIIVDGNGTILLINAQTESAFGYTRAELVGQPIEVLVPQPYRGQHPVHRTRYFEAPRPRGMGRGIDLYGQRKDGSHFPAEISLSPTQTPGAQLIIAAVRDISERKRLEELRRRSLEDANRLKSEFLANMSHELRTPLNSIIGFAKLMQHGRVGAVSDTQREYLGDILNSSNHLLQLINDILDLSKIEAGRMDFFPEPIDLPQLVGEVRDSIRAVAAAKRIAIEVNIERDCVGLELDPAKLKQVLYNYVSNALKFTEDGGRVTISARLEGSESFRLEVTDSGIGIHADDLGKLFTEFRQLDASAAKRHQGTGLGLALTKRIVEGQSGHVGVESTWGNGSTFFAVLPRVTLPSANGPPPHASSP